ncbi:MAG: hypothetical protein KGL46_14345, partial [Hyphomicrobiales bacterium]|nr:hypothetical protein [Hyphomicrobiales bacterium]
NAATDAARSAQASANRAQQNVQQAASGGLPGWLWPLLGLILLGLVAWYFMSSRTPEPVVTKPAVTTQAPAPVAPAAPQTAAPAAPTAPTMPAAPTIDAKALTDQATSTLKGMTDAFGSIHDVASANAALPKLAEQTNALDKVTTALNSLPAPARAAVTGPLTSLVGPIREQIAKVMAIPGVGDVLKPVVDPILSRLDMISK